MMKSIQIKSWALVAAAILGSGFGGIAVAGTLIPDHSVGWRKLTPRLQRQIHGLQREVRELTFPGVRKRFVPVPITGQQGERGEAGPPGSPGRDAEPTAEPEAGQGFVWDESVSAVGGSSAILEAVLSTDGRQETIEWLGEVYPQPDDGLYYQFQLAIDPASLRPEVSCPAIDAPNVGCFGSLLHDGSADHERQAGDLPTWGILPAADGTRVRLEVQGLRPDTRYFFRVVAVQRVQKVDVIEWLAPPTYGQTMSFTTADLVVLDEVGVDEPEEDPAKQDS